MERSKSDPFHALLAWEWYDIEVGDLLDKYGISMLLDDRRPIGSVSMEPATDLMTTATGSVSIYRATPEWCDKVAAALVHLVNLSKPLKPAARPKYGIVKGRHCVSFRFCGACSPGV